MILYLVRHGETEWHAENRYAGISDVALTPLGMEQGKLLADWAVSADLDLIVSSDLSRAVKTAEPSIQRTKLPHKIDSRFREVNFGAGEGLTSAEMDLEFPEARAAFISAPAENALPNGERGVDAVARSFEALYELVASEIADRVLLVAHSTLGRLMLCALTGLPLNDYRTKFPKMVNGAVTTVEISKVSEPAQLFGGGKLISLNVLPG